MGDNTEHLKEWGSLDGESGQVFDREKSKPLNKLFIHLSKDGTPVDHAIRCEI